MDENERIMNIPLKDTKAVPRSKRANRAIKEIREYVARHMKVDDDDVWIDTGVNELIWSRGIQKPPTKVTIRAVRFEDGLVEVSLAKE
ncbi:MAG: large subunit ribosomal protein L31e [Candidatus Methanomethylophilaceae archaeon]|jgi:LSU ribosomal protein L31E|nr:large subunit ribosomal protein L31e [Candidatus Methanomethylophilaceae archaeon]MDI3542229.1 large subunit ribosomal protein L31e [Candidatus Methanomethylophilaceae archaeon]HIJ00561.1 50S ribosomal protein L31e [Candidatus Methanomethylophilaceae archaeon]